MRFNAKAQASERVAQTILGGSDMTNVVPLKRGA
jgi:hypothetical protein